MATFKAFGALACAAILASSSMVSAAAITAGNLVIYRVGDGAAVLGATATAVFLDEYTTAGVLVQSIPVPATGATSLTASGTAVTEGIMSVAADTKTVVFTGYRKDVGATNPSGDTPATTNRVIATMGINGVVNTSVALTDTTGTIRSAATTDLSTFYVGTSAAVRQVPTPGAAATSVQIEARNSRQVLLNGTTLLASNGAAITPKVQSYGTLPTAATTPTPIVTLLATDAVNGFALADLSPTVAGVDTLYALSTVENLLRKYTFDGSAWTLSGSVAAGSAQNLTLITSATGTDLYLTSAAAIRKLSDLSGYNGTLTGTSVVIASAPTSTGFRGIAVVPEPAALAAIAPAALLLGRRLR